MPEQQQSTSSNISETSSQASSLDLEKTPQLSSHGTDTFSTDTFSSQSEVVSIPGPSKPQDKHIEQPSVLKLFSHVKSYKGKFLGFM